MGAIEIIDKESPLYAKQERFIDKVLDVANRHVSSGCDISVVQSFHDPLQLFGYGNYKYIFKCESKNKVLDTVTLYIDFDMMSDSYAVTAGVYIAMEFERYNKA